jgi:hypothetical protein
MFAGPARGAVGFVGNNLLLFFTLAGRGKTSLSVTTHATDGKSVIEHVRREKKWHTSLSEPTSVSLFLFTTSIRPS